MKQLKIIGLITMIISISLFTNPIKAQQMATANKSLSPQEQSIISISALTAKGDLDKLKTALNAGLENGLTVNEIKEALVHTYAYCGFPRSIRGLQTFMEVLDERKATGINDKVGKEASKIDKTDSKYERGKKILGELTKTPQPDTLKGYSAFAPTIDTFLKEHLFADIFERDVLSYAQRELVTVSVIAAIGDAEPMLKSHLTICLNVGLTPEQLQEYVDVLKTTLGKKEAKSAQKVLDEVLKGYKSK
ncbi:carboxymuconolactone decarboxylase family protein [Chryseobacterium sp. SIMBA_029]|uniref:carboxymuconolactone decarboxylase family protein n=1 Tax=Chryseobacterium sp. SIMBA_029 TaxID=3085772 RepID=UPI003978CD6A